jgi:tetratricopeptide (TPR) repeat protein
LAEYLKVMEKSRTICENNTSGDDGLNNSLQILEGKICLWQNQPHVAEQWQQVAISRLEQLQTTRRHDPVPLSRANVALGETLQYLKDYPAAVEAVKAALARTESCASQKTDIRAAALYALGNIQPPEGNLQGARQSHFQTLHLLQYEDKESFNTAISLHKVGVLLYEDGNSAKAIGYLREAMRIFNDIGTSVDRYKDEFQAREDYLRDRLCPFRCRYKWLCQG